MKKTIIINDITKVQEGDKAYFQNCDFGFTVIDTDEYDPVFRLEVKSPISEYGIWADSALFDHATREVEEPEWPNPHEAKLHVYLGSDGVRYIYNPVDEHDKDPWLVENHFICHTRETMGSYHRDALPLTELELVPKKRES